ncbi:PKD domain-containing protein [Marinoscillum sp.]|uniref:PKD domain-containing protein n=1 Tax=Marinoscillum sp. TaxID=2024838 RepID=UPI003BAB0640
MIRRVVYIAILSCFFTQAMAQTLLYNKNTEIKVDANATLYVSGNYVDSTDASTLMVFLQGELLLGGNFNNYGTTAVIDSSAVTLGTVHLNSSSQINGGSVYLPNLRVSGSSTTTLNTNLRVNDYIDLTTGSINLNERTISFKKDSTDHLLGETESTTFTGEGILDFPIAQIETSNNWENMGLGFDLGSGSLVGTKIRRRYRDQSFTVAGSDNTSARYFEFSYDNNATDSDTLYTLNFHYFDSEIPAALSGENLAIYARIDSLDNSWVKIGDDISTSNVVKAVDVPVNTTTPYVFTLGRAVCETIPTDPPSVVGGTINEDSIDVCEAGSLTLTSNAFYSEWRDGTGTVLSVDWGASASNQLSIPDIELTNNNDEYILYERTRDGCENTRRYIINVIPLPIPSFSVANENQICKGDVVDFTNTTDLVESNITVNSYQWNFDDAASGSVNTSTSENPSHQFNSTRASGFDVTLTVTNNYGCVDSVTNNVTIQTLPHASFTVDAEVCEGTMISTTNASTSTLYDGVTDGDLSYIWVFNDSLVVNDSAFTTDASYTYYEWGNRDIYLLATETNSTCQDDTTISIFVNPLPDPNFNFQVDGGDIDGLTDGVCEGTVIDMDNLSIIPNGTITDHDWSFGNGESSIEINPSLSYSPANTYDVHLTLTSDELCVDDLTKSIVIHPVPDGDQLYIFGEDNIDENLACLNEDLEFQSNVSISSGSITSYSWVFGDGDTLTSTQPNQIHAYSEALNYDIELTVTSDQGCVHTVENDSIFRVLPDPVASFTYDQVCAGDTVWFYAQAPDFTDNVQYNWTFGSTGSSTLQNPYYVTTDDVTSYQVSLSVSIDNGCSDDTTVTVDLYQIPDIQVDDFVISVDGSVTYNPVQPGDFPQASEGSFLWARNGATLSTTPVLTTTETGNYKLSVSTNDGSCELEDNLLVLIVEPSTIPTELQGCGSLSIDATPDDYPEYGTLTYSWTKDGIPYATSAEITPTVSGEFTVVVTYAYGGASDSYSHTIDVVVDQPLVLDLGDDQVICESESVRLESNISVDSAFWTNSAGDTVSTASFYDASDADTYKLVVYQSTCTADATVKVTTVPKPEAGFQVSSNEICVGEPVNLSSIVQSAPGDAIESFDWSFGDGTSSTLQNPSKSYSSSGTYTISLTVASSEGCSDSYSEVVTVNPLPFVSFSVTSTCQGQEIALINNTTLADASGLTYYWDFGDGKNATDVTPSQTYTSPGDYTITLTATSGNGCSASSSQVVTISPRPQGNFQLKNDVDEVITAACSQQEVFFDNNTIDPNGDPISYSWDFGDGSTSTLSDPSHTYSASGTYTIVLEMTTVSSCVYIQERTLTINPLVDVDFSFSNVCDGEEVSFVNNSTISSGSNISYLWDFGDGTSSSQVNPDHTYSTYGEYSVSLTAESNRGCETVLTQNVDVYRKPSFDLGDYKISVTGSALLDPSDDPSAYLPVGSSYDWSKGSSLASTPTYEATTSGVYSVMVASPAPQNCIFETAIPVYILDPNEFGNDLTACEEYLLDAEPLNYPGQSATVSYKWFKDGIDIDVADSEYLVTESGSYEVEVTFTVTAIAGNPSLSYTDQIDLTIQDAAEAVDLGDTVTLCRNGSIILNSNVVADSYQWKNLSTNTDLGTSASQEITEVGYYQLAITSGSCNSVGTVEVIEASTPVAGFIAENSYCVNSTVHFEEVSFSDDPENDIIDYSWDFGDGSSSSMPDPDKLFATSGTYEITLTVETENGCTDSFSKEITIQDNPQPDFNTSNICLGEAATFTDASTLVGNASYTWNFGDGDYSNEKEPTHVYKESGTYDVSLMLENSCEATFTTQIEVYENPTIFNSDVLTTCGPSLDLDAGMGMTSYRWYDASTNSTLATSQTYTASSNQSLGIEVVTGAGCTYSEEVDVILNSTISVDLGADRTICDSEVLNPGAFPGASFVWSTGATSATLEVTSSGTYSVDITDQNGCTTSDEVIITVASAPVLELGEDQTICFGEELILDAQNSGAQYLWSDGSTAQTISITESGEYAVEVTRGNCSVVDTISVVVLDELSVDFDYSGSCSGSATLFEYTGSETNISYLWEFDDGSQSVQDSPSKYFNSGTHNVTLTITGEDGCSASTTKVVEVSPVIDPDFTMTNACANADLQFTNASTYLGTDDLTFDWNFGDGTTSTEENPTNQYASPGEYTVRLQVTNSFGCSSVITQSVEVLSSPSVTLNDVASCDNTVFLDAGSGATSYRWSDLSTSQILEVTSSGTYAVEVTAANGCVASDTAEVILYEYDQPNLGEDLESCGSVSLDPAATADSYEWSTGATTSAITTSISGTYWVRTISADLCQSTDTIEVVINSEPAFDLGSNLEICAGDTISLAPATSESVASYDWNNGSSASSLEVFETGTYSVTLTTIEGCEFTDSLEVEVKDLPASPLNDAYTTCESQILDAQNSGSTYVWSTGALSSSIEVTNSGTYWVQITNADGCALIDSTEVTITPTPSLELGFDQTICTDETITLDAENIGANYLWSTGATTQTIEVDQSGDYGVEVSYGGCSVSDTISITVLEELSIDFSFSEGCAGTATSLEYTGTSTPQSYLWSFGDGTQSVVASPNKVFASSGNYEVTLTVTTSAGCSASVVKSIVVSPRIQPNFAFNNVCQNAQVQFTNGTVYTGDDELSYDWYFGDGQTSTEQTPSHQYSEAGTYVVRLEVSNDNSCSEFISKTLIVGAAPVVSIGDSLSSCNSSIVLNAGNTGSTFRWSDNSSQQTFEVTRSGTYAVEVTGSNGCTASDTVFVELYEYETPDLGADDEVCGNLVLEAGAAADSYQWSTGENTASINVSQTGTYWVQTISTDLCISYDTIDVIVNPLPEFDLGADAQLCEGDTLVLTASSTEVVTSYLWTDGSTDSDLEVYASGTYGATLYTAEGCTYSDEIEVTFDELPESLLDESYLGCDQLTLEVSSPGSAIRWSNGDIRPYLEITESGTYWVEITTRNGCSFRDSAFVEIIKMTPPDLGTDIELCYDEEVTLDAGAYESYEWNGIAGGRYLDVGVSGVYQLIVTNEYGCTRTDEIEVTIREPLGLDLEDERIVCEGSEFTIDAGVTGDGLTYEWGSDAGITGTEQFIDAVEPGLYWVTVTDEFGCSHTDAINITTTTQSIEGSFLMPSQVSVGERVNFVQLTEPAPEWFFWEFGDGRTNDKVFNPTYRYIQPGTYDVRLTVSNGICEHILTKQIEVREGRTADLGDEKIQFIDFEKLSIYPNPASEYVTIDFDLTTTATVNLQVYDFSGMKVAHHQFDEELGSYQLDISTLPSGTYIVLMQAGSSIKKLRFVKMK